MATAYSAGLRVSAEAIVHSSRRLPLRGTVLLEEGALVAPEDVVARTELPGKVFPVNIANKLGCLPGEVRELLVVGEGDAVEAGGILARSRGLFGWFRTEVSSPIAGTLESVSKRTGQAILRAAPIPVEVAAHIRGRVIEVIPEEGVVLETLGTLVQGIFGFGGEVHGPIRVISADPLATITPELIPDDMAGQVGVGGARLTIEAYEKAATVGARALVVGGFHYRDIREILGYEVGVAITGHEDVPTTLVLTEGFGDIGMARRAHELLSKAEGREASVSGATQIRAGVIRPQVVVPAEIEAGDEKQPDYEGHGLEVGSSVRGIRVPHFGKIGSVEELPVPLQRTPAGSQVRVLAVRWENGEAAVLPRANVEVIEDL